jgi:transposase
MQEQRKLSKRQKGGKNRAKQRRKVAKPHEKVANQRISWCQAPTPVIEDVDDRFERLNDHLQDG